LVAEAEAVEVGVAWALSMALEVRVAASSFLLENRE